MAGSAWAQTQTVVVPAAAAGAAGAGGNSIPLGNFSGGTYQVMYAETEMADVPPGSTITGIQLRLRNTATSSFPPTAKNIPKFDLRLAGSTLTPGTMTTTFATNMQDAVLVRSGALSLAAGVYPGGAASGLAPEDWGPVISFSTPYIYRGGPLVMEFRTEQPSTVSPFSAESISTPGLTFMSATPSTAATAPSTNAGQGLVALLTFTLPATPFQTGVTRLLIQDDLANIRGSSSNLFPLGVAARTMQLIAAESEMRRLGRGSQLVGLMYRNAASTWPSGAQSFTKYDIQLSRALNSPASMSDTIALNTGPDATLVRSGALAIASGELAGLGPNPRPAPWTFDIPFATPYSYLGGPLLTVVRHDGVSGGSAAQVAGTLLTDPIYGTRVNARTTTATSSVVTVTDSAFSYTAQMWQADSGSIAPNANTTVRGNTTILNSPAFSNPITSQMVINASELTYLPVGSQITGMSFRGVSNSNVPTSNVVFSDYQVFVSTAANRPASMSATFANNEGADKVQVRSGGLFFGAGSLPGNPTVNKFGPTINFDRAFIYQGGDLCITIRHSGNQEESINIDGTTNTNLMRTVSGSGINAASGSIIGAGPIVRLAYNPSVVAPAAIDNTSGQNGYAVFFSDAGNVFQSVYAAEQLRGLRVGSVITGMSLRRYSKSSGGAPWPPADTLINRFDITLSTSPVLPQSMSDTFASNIGPDAILVKSGSITIPAGAFTYVQSNTRPNEYEWFIQFTEPFVYKGGPLSATIRNDSGVAGASFYGDVFEGSSSIASGRWAIDAGVDAPMHTQSGATGALAIRFVFVPKNFCPADLTNDGIVEDADFVVFLAEYNTLDCADSSMEQGCPADLNYDRAVDDLDFQTFLVAYNALLCP